MACRNVVHMLSIVSTLGSGPMDGHTKRAESRSCDQGGRGGGHCSGGGGNMSRIITDDVRTIVG